MTKLFAAVVFDTGYCPAAYGLLTQVDGHSLPSCWSHTWLLQRLERALSDGLPYLAAQQCHFAQLQQLFEDFVYMPGAAPHRIKLAKVLSDGGFHVLSVDYRGFGDSTGTPTEEGLTRDAICVYEWTKARSGCPVDAIVLEAPFTNMWVASINYPLLKLYEIARKAYRNKDRVKMVVFPPGFHHNLLCKSPLLLRSVRDFLSQQWA
ncbi:Abhydrolase domain-containing protein 12B [Cricetulus griseus]|uniref:Abhydrolase domain-containing protein 12B n=1 Tax=Cricetulus griseus TaxID=10029 RepID=G3ILF8_CRIGR|nr:Abhydrolase domain-containing protein 12B [Cricetulus griseus]